MFNLSLNYIIPRFSWVEHSELDYRVEDSKTGSYTIEEITLPTYVIVLVSVFFIMRIVSHFQKGKVKYYYHPDSKLMEKFLTETDVNEQVYAPYWFTTSGVL